MDYDHYDNDERYTLVLTQARTDGHFHQAYSIHDKDEGGGVLVLGDEDHAKDICDRLNGRK